MGARTRIFWEHRCAAQALSLRNHLDHRARRRCRTHHGDCLLAQRRTLSKGAGPLAVAANGKSAYDVGETLYAAIDGKQRIETTKAWFDGELPVPASWFEADHIEQTVDTEDGPYVTFKGLTLTGQRLMSNSAILPVVTAKVPSIQAEANLYLLVNGAGVAQSDADYERVEKIASS